jgi:hypothetical protein
MKNEKHDLQAFKEAIANLEARVSRIEKNLIEIRGYFAGEKEPEKDELFGVEKGQVSLEFRIGQYWLARLGALVLLIGIGFFISYPLPGLPPLPAVIFGFTAIGGLFVLSRVWQKDYRYLSQILFGGSLVLLYFATLRLHFIGEHPLLHQKSLGMILLLAVLAGGLTLSVRKKSEVLAAIILGLFYTTSLFIDTASIAFSLIVISAVLTAYLLLARGWRTLASISLILAYLSHLIWLFNNPLVGNPVQARPSPHGNWAYLPVYGTVFALAAVIQEKKRAGGVFGTLFSILNGSGFFVIGLFNVLGYYPEWTDLFGLWTAIFFAALGLAARKIDPETKAAPLYVCFGFVALTLSIFARFPSPDYFVWLGWQSLLVIVIAIWFRSRIIVLANIFIYLGIYLWYLAAIPSNDLVNLSYAVTALVSARVLNWKKERLALKTDLIRNLYLASAFIIVLYGLHHAVSEKYVSLSWLGASLLYFTISLVLKNKKYRWMAILTAFATVVHIFVIDVSRSSPGFRIILFIGVGMVLVFFSLAYARNRKKSTEIDTE